MRFRYLSPAYGFDSTMQHIGAPDNARSKFLAMCETMVNSEDLIGIYIPEGTEEVYQPGNSRGRIVGGIQMIDMNPGEKMEHYPHYDWDGSKRWPIGWPCRVVYAPDPTECPVLRSIVERFFGANNFQPFVSQFQHGPIQLNADMTRALGEAYNRFQPLE